MKLFLKSVILSLLCWAGIHNWKTDVVFGKKKLEHCSGYDEMYDYVKPRWHIHGRSCKACENKQYFYMNWITCGWENVI